MLCNILIKKMEILIEFSEIKMKKHYMYISYLEIPLHRIPGEEYKTR